MSESHDPYQPPRSMLYGNARPPRTRAVVHGEPAGKGRRFANYLIDMAAFYALAMVVGVAAALLGGEGTIRWLESLGVFESYALGFVLLLFYYVPLEAGFGATLGKLVTGTRVVDAYGEKPNLLQAMLRTLCRFIPFEPFSVLLTDEGRGWHDSLSSTTVVRKQ